MINYIVGRDQDWPTAVKIGKDCEIERDVLFYLRKASSEVIIGDRVYLGRGVEFESYGAKISVGNDCMIASGCKLIDHDHGTELGIAMRDQPVPIAPIMIEDDVWLGANVIVLRGTTIGTGAIVGAGAVVTKNVPANEVWVGVPAKKISERPLKTKYPSINP